MATRTTYSSASGDFTGAAYADDVAGHVKRLYDASAFPLKSVGGTANAVTATLDPVLDAGGLVDGMLFTISWPATNTGGMTLAINGGAAVPVLDALGAALVAGSVSAALRSILCFVAGSFRIVTPLLVGGGASASESYYWAFTSSGTWNKPSGLDPDRMVVVELWGAGGGGASTAASNGSGGAGGGYLCRMFRLSQIPASVSVAIGAGGAGGVGANVAGANGGATTFGALMSAPGGGGGQVGAASAAGGTPATADEPGGSSPSGAAGAAALRAGGAGGGAKNGVSAGGASLLGGDGGASGNGAAGAAGAAPAGGGGGGYGANGGAGARGEARIWIT